MKNKKILSWGLLIAWAGLIFFFSSQQANSSSNLSNGIMDWVNAWLPFSLTSHQVRKIAHFTEFLILGVLSLNVVHFYKKITVKELSFVLLLCAFYALSDEFHQFFVPGRGPQIKDAALDTFGSATGILSSYFLYFKKHSK